MTRFAFRSPVVVPLLHFGTRKPLPPDPRAHETFRITARFSDPDVIQPTLTHRAVDIGNFRCGDPIVAMAAGLARQQTDKAMARGAPTNALGIVIDHGSQVSSEYWHLAEFEVANGTRVEAGDRIGTVGNTGHAASCHCHVEIKVNGRRIDPEPLMFGTVLTVGEGGPSMPLRFASANYRPIVNRGFETLASARFRAAPSTKSTTLKVFAAGSPVVPSGAAKGEDLVDPTPAPGFRTDEWLEARMLVGGNFQLGYFHASVVRGERRIE